MHCCDELGCFGEGGGDEEEVVYQPEEQAVVGVVIGEQKGEVGALEVGVEVVAEGGGNHRALRDAGFLAVVFLAYADEVVFDVGRG